VGRPDAHAGEVPVAYVTTAPGASVTETELRAWAGARAAERAAAPKSVTIVDSLPTTAIGKPYKLALRARAAVTAISEALCGIGGIDSVDAVVDDGSVVVRATVTDEAHYEAVNAALARFPLRSVIEERS
jgi:fatty-acyl-CoA synthase